MDIPKTVRIVLSIGVLIASLAGCGTAATVTSTPAPSIAISPTIMLSSPTALEPSPTATVIPATTTPLPTATAVLPTATALPPTATLIPGTGKIEGRVTLENSDQAISTALVELTPPISKGVVEPIAKTATDKDGRFIFEGVRPGTYNIAVTVRGGGCFAFDPREFTIAAGEIVNRTLTLPCSQ